MKYAILILLALSSILMGQAAPVNLSETKIKDGVEQPMMTGELMGMHYQKWTGKRVLVSKAAMAKQIAFVHRGEMTYGEAARLLEKAALLEDLVFVPSGEDEVKLVLVKNGRRQGVPVVVDSDLLPKGDKLVSYVMVLKHVRPEEAMKIFNSVVSQTSPGGSIVSVPNTSSLIITENTALIRTLIEIQEKIDIAQEMSSQKMIVLKNADAEEIASHIQSILDFSAEQNTVLTNTNANTNANANTKPANNAGAKNAVAKNTPVQGRSFSSVKVLPDPRTNRIFIMGRPVDIAFAETLIAEFDKPIQSRSYYKQKLHYLSVSEFLPIARNAIKRMDNKSNNSGGTNSGSTNRANAGGSLGDGLAESERLEYPESILVGKTLLVADNANNSLIVQGPPQSIALVKDLIREMDLASEQVQITAVFGRYNLNNTKDFGVDFVRLGNNAQNGSGAAIGNRTGFPILVDPATLDGAGDFPSAVTGLSIYGKIGNSFFPTLRALQSTGNFKLLARPTVFTTNNKKAVLSSGQSIAVPTNSISQNTGAGGVVAQSTNIEFKNVLLKLEVIPLVNSKDEVTLQISFTNDNIIGNQVIDGNSIPTIGKEELLTTVTIPNGATIALGGLITERETKSKTGVPILSSIPGIKKIFSSTKKETIKEELVIFIQPKIVDTKESLKELQRQNQRASQLARDVQGVGVLPALPEKERAAGKKDPRADRFRSPSRR